MNAVVFFLGETTANGGGGNHVRVWISCGLRISCEYVKISCTLVTISCKDVTISYGNVTISRGLRISCRFVKISCKLVTISCRDVNISCTNVTISRNPRNNQAYPKWASHSQKGNHFQHGYQANHVQIWQQPPGTPNPLSSPHPKKTEEKHKVFLPLLI